MGKLVRDRIPEIIRADGGTPIVTVLRGQDLHAALKAKLVEEAQELLAADGAHEAEELADVLEVIEALLEVMDRRHVAEVGALKRSTRGGFQEGCYLH